MSGPLFIVLAAVLALGAGLVGFYAGRETAKPAAVALPTLAAAAASPDEPAQVAENTNPVTDTPVPASSATPVPPTPLPTVPPTVTALPTEAPSPTAVAPAATPVQPEQIDPPAGSPLTGAEYETLYEVWELIAGQYDGSLPPSEEIVDSIISGSLETLDDDYTRYVPADVAERMRQDAEGAVEGIGAFVMENDEGLFEIVRPIDGQPADLAGVRAGDILTGIDGESVLDLSFDEVILLVRGPQGTSVNLTFLRDGEEIEFTIVRTRFEVPIVEFEILPSEMTSDQVIGYVRLTEFSRNAEERLWEALEQVLDAGATGLVLDLRDNPGGFLDQSVAVADAFLPDGVVLYERNIRGLDETFRTRDGDAAESIPLVVLVNAGSASASEIVAGALQDRGRAMLVGETTFGKGSVQQIHPLSDGSELRVTIARWYTPNNNTIDGTGITPNFEVESPEDLGGPDDGQLQRAIEYLLTGQ